MCAKTIPEIDDWSATCSIYDICEKKSTKILAGGLLRVSLDLPMGIRPCCTVLIQPDVGTTRLDIDSRFGMQVISSRGDIPIFCITFLYDETAGEQRLVSAKVSFSKYPEVWPQKAKKPWLLWLEEKASQIIDETNMSYSVCEWLEYSSTDFFDVVATDTNNEFTAIVCIDYPLDYYNNESVPTISGRLITLPTKDESKEPDDNSSPLSFAKDVINSKWRDWVHTQCPICFDEFVVSEATVTECGHAYCNECISMYARTTLSELKGGRPNPFKCPVTSCRRTMRLDPEVKNILSSEEWKSIERWQKDTDHPPATMLKTCLRKRCGKGLMRHETPESSFIYCEVCEFQCCELCMLRPHRGFDCDPSQILRLCAKYRDASEKIKRKCEERWPWIKEYSISRISSDEDAIAW
eukprot:CAMPEP_0185737926 /NCGR_PEP_ID=MMETSP1171-20130828/31613_1 /TAXON_ID=374046 /ORGANISM="Helicotheca tamensis, Strain CCMP826" /LENGTH=408 /DNA_ID=CAMNT_0028408977 /DNA_START=53 /DNA_END=1276 /DNA_ORIENTATION=+